MGSGVSFGRGADSDRPKGTILGCSGSTCEKPARDPYIIHGNIALSMVVSLYFAGKSHVSNGQNISFKESCVKTRLPPVLEPVGS